MTHKRLFFFSIIIAACFLGWRQEGFSMEFYWGSHPGHERLVFEFTEEADVNYDVSRTGKQELTLELPGSVVEDIEMPSGRIFSGSTLFEGVGVEANLFKIKINTNAFGYISYSQPQENKIIVDIFRDPLGAQWEPDSGIEPPAPQPQEEAGSDPPPFIPAPLPKVQEEDPEISPSEPAPMAAYKLRSPIQRNEPPDMIQLDPDISQLDPDISQVEPAAEEGSSRIMQRIQRDEPQDIQPDQLQTASEEIIEDGILEEEGALEAQEEFQPDLDEPADESEDYGELIFAARAMMSGGDFKGAANILEELIDDPELPAEYLEDALYTYAEANFQRFRNDLRNNFTDVIAPFERAMNYDPNSERLPDALLNLGYIHLQVGNEPEARGYFNLLRDEYPQDPAVPSTYYYWGDYYARQGKFQKAVDNFEHIVQEYPEDELVRPAAVNLAHALSELDFHKQSLDILEFIESRWPRNYIDDPDFLILSGYILYRNDRLDEARNRFLHYINLIPDGDQVAVSMARIGDIYLLQDKREAAKDMHEQTVRMYPDQEGGLIAAMRLAEEGIY
ncbi:MAG: tetratricopeptide repeat protein, partial [Desulfonatronovibrio sp.]